MLWSGWRTSTRNVDAGEGKKAVALQELLSEPRVEDYSAGSRRLLEDLDSSIPLAYHEKIAQMASSRRPSTAPGPTRDTQAPSRTSKSAFWSFGSTDKHSSDSTAAGLNTIAQTRASGPVATSSPLLLSFSDDHGRLRKTPPNHLKKSRRASFFRSSGYVSDDNGGDAGGGLRGRKADVLDVHRSPRRVGKTQLQSTPEEAHEVSDLSLHLVPERVRRAQGLHSFSPPTLSSGNLQSPPSRSRSGSSVSALSRPPPSPSSSPLLPPIAPSKSLLPIAASFSQYGVPGPANDLKPNRYPARPPQRKTSRRPSTASGVLEGSFAREMMQPPAAPYLHPVSTHSSPKSKKTEAPTTLEQSHFSTADRTILAELKENLTARDSQFVRKNGRKHHPYSAKEVPFPRNYERIVLDHEMWETLFYQQLTKDVTFHRFETPPSKALDIGCGSGAWVLNASRVWKQTHFVGLDVVPLHPDLSRVGSTDLANRISWVQANFLEGLPFPNEEFDFVMVKRIARGVPEDKWDALLEEIVRVMKPGAAIEVVEEELYFPGSMSDPPILAAGSTVSNASTSNLSTTSTTSHDSNPTSAPPPWSQSSPSLVAPFPRTKRLSEPTDNGPHKRTERGDVNASIGTVQAEKLRSSVSASDLGRRRLRSGSGGMRDELGISATPYMCGLTEGVEVSGPGPVRSSKDDAAAHARNRSKEQFNVTTSTTSTSLLDVPPQRPKTAQPISPPRPPGRKRGMSASRVGAPISGIPPSPPIPFQLQPPSIGSALEQSQVNVNAPAYADGLPVSTPEPPAPEHRMASLFRTPTKGRKSEKEKEREREKEKEDGGGSSREGPTQPEYPRMLYRPSPRTPFNPRNHSLLERIYCEMHEARFINLTPLALLAASLGLYFKHVKSHAPISFAFPPKPKKKYVLEQTKPGAYPWSDDEEDPLFPQINEEDTASSADGLQRRSSKRTSDKADDSAPQYIVLDNARLLASAPRTAKPRTYSESAHSTASTETISATSPSRSMRSFRAFAVSVSPDRSQPDTVSLIDAPRQQARIQVNVPSVPGKALEIDLRSLHMHLATRVSETLGCAEAMWEWVVAEQQRHAAERASGRGRARSVGEEMEEEGDAQMRLIHEMTRADFDACLSRFEMDMHDNVALSHALEQHLNWNPALPHTRTAERKSFETACAIWDTQQTAHAADADGESERSCTSSAFEQPQPRFSRTFRIFAAWKEGA